MLCICSVVQFHTSIPSSGDDVQILIVCAVVCVEEFAGHDLIEGLELLEDCPAVGGCEGEVPIVARGDEELAGGRELHAGDQLVVRQDGRYLLAHSDVPDKQLGVGAARCQMVAVTAPVEGVHRPDVSVPMEIEDRLPRTEVPELDDGVIARRGEQRAVWVDRQRVHRVCVALLVVEFLRLLHVPETPGEVCRS